MANIFQNLEAAGMMAGAITEGEMKEAMSVAMAANFQAGDIMVSTQQMTKFTPYSVEMSEPAYAFRAGVGPEDELTFIFDLSNVQQNEYMGIIGDTHGHITARKCNCQGDLPFMKPTLSGCADYENWRSQLCGTRTVAAWYQIAVQDMTGNGFVDTDFSVYVDSANAQRHMQMESRSMASLITMTQNHRDIMRNTFKKPFVFSGFEAITLGKLKKGYKYTVTLNFLGNLG